MSHRERLPNHSGLEIPALSGLKDYLTSRVIGQPRAIESCIRSFNLALANLLPDWRPMSINFRAGPTGVGKTETSIALADFLWEGEKQAGIEYPRPPIVKVDCGLFEGGFAATELIGVPAGYVGSRAHEKGATEPLLIEKNFPPNRLMVLLFDEIEKAFGDEFSSYRQGSVVLGILLAMLDKGEITNRWDVGKPVSFRNTIIDFTSNIGARDIVDAAKKQPMGFNIRGAVGQIIGRSDVAEDRGIYLSEDEVETLNKGIYRLTKDSFVRTFSPEFRNRMDPLEVYRFFSRPDFSKLLEIEMVKLNKQLEGHKLRVDISQNAKDWILNHGVVREDGARSIQRSLLRKIVHPLAAYINAGLVKSGDLLDLDVKEPKDKESVLEVFVIR